MNTEVSLQYLLGNHVDRVKIWVDEKLLTKKKVNTTMVIVEGVADVYVYESLLNKEKTEIFPVPSDEGKEFVQEAIRYIDEQRQMAEETKQSKRDQELFKGIIAIVDEDYESIQGISISPMNTPIFTTGDHDVETILIKSQALNKYIFRLIPHDPEQPSKKKKSEEQIDKVNQSLQTLGLTMGFMRLAFLKSRYSGKINEWDKRCFISYNSQSGDFEINEDNMICHIVDNCIRDNKLQRNRQIQGLKEQFKNVKSNYREIDNWKIMQGHDLINILINILSIYLQKYGESRKEIFRRMRIPERATPNNNEWFFISGNEGTKYENDVVSDLIMCYEQNDFKQTDLYKKLKEWEDDETNTYKVLQ